MSIHIRRALAVLGTAGLVTALAAAPASAGDTTTTFALTGGSLSISEPASKNLGSASTSAGTISGSLGNVTVTDARGSAVATWTATAASSDFVTGGGGTGEVIAKSGVSYAATLGTTTGLNGAFLGSPAGVALSSPQSVVTGAAVGNNTAQWNPTVTVTIPATGVVVGTYTGTITHSVS